MPLRCIRKKKRNVAEGCSALGLARFQLRRSISCLPSLTQTSLCPRQSVHPPHSLPGSLPRPEPLTSQTSGTAGHNARLQGQLGRTRQRCAAASLSPAMKGAPQCRLPPAPLPSPRQQLPPAPGSHRASPVLDIFPCTKACLAQSSLVTNTLCPSVFPSPPKHCPFPPTAAPPATLQLKESLSQELALAHTEEGGGTDQASPCAAAAGSHPDPAAGRGHAMAPSCLGTASPHTKQTGLVGLGWIHAELVPPTPERPCCAPPILQGLSFSTVGLIPLSPLTPLTGVTQSGEEGRGTGGAGCSWPGDPLCSGLRKRPPQPCSIHQQDELTDMAALTPAMRELQLSSCTRLGKPPRAQCPCCTPQPGSRQGQLSKGTERRVFITGQAFAREEQMCPWKR